MKLHLLPCLLVSALLCLPHLSLSGEVTLAWEPVVDSRLAGYAIYYGLTPGQYDVPVDVGNVTLYTVSGLGPGTYYFAVKAYGTAGEQSGYSNEVSAAISPPDTTPPLISNIIASNISASSATISWATDEGSDSQIEYGTTTAYGNSTALDPAVVISHSQNLTGLVDSTTYHYRVKSRDSAGNPAVSADQSFTTEAPPDTTPPVISAIASSNLTTSSATISWITDEGSDSQVEYGTTTSYGQSTALDPVLVTAHTQSLTGLSAGTVYHFRVRSKDAAGNPAVSADYTFATLPAIDIITGLAAAFAFDEGSGSTSADFSGNGNTARIYSASWTGGKYGSALYFNGNKSYVSAGTSRLPGVNQPKTISCWIYLVKKSTTIQSMVELGNLAASATVGYGHKRSQVGVTGFGDTWLAVAALPSLKVWHHLGYVFDGTQNRFYIDGVLAGTSTIGAVAAPVTSFELGRWIGGSEYFQGSIDDVRVYSRALSLDELKLAMNTPVASAGTMSAAATAAVPEVLAAAETTQLQASPSADIQLERDSYRQGDTVNVKAFTIGNPSAQSREIEVKTWMDLPGLLPVRLDLVSGDVITLEAESSKDYGTASLLALSPDAPVGTGEADARLLDPVTGDVLAEDINPFTISFARGSKTQAAVEAVPEINIVLDTIEGKYVISNRGAAQAAVEFKVWIEIAGRDPISVLSIGAGGNVIVPAGSEISFDPLSSFQLPTESYVMRARVLDAASGEILCEE